MNSLKHIINGLLLLDLIILEAIDARPNATTLHRIFLPMGQV